jgi:hypothetical protein
MITSESLHALFKPLFPGLLGIEFSELTAE